MANFITLGTGDQLIIQIPIKRTTGWADELKAEFFQKLVEHDHSGSGKGLPIAGSSISADSVTGAAIRLANDEYLRARNAADGADVNIVKVNATDEIEFGAQILAASITTATLTTANITTSNNTNTTTSDISENSSDIALANNSTATVFALTTDEAYTVHYKVVRNTTLQTGTLEVDENSSTVTDEFIGSDSGVTFDINSGNLRATSTDDTDASTITYVRIRR